MQESTWTGQNTISEMLERIRATARIELVYGKERKVGDKTLTRSPRSLTRSAPAPAVAQP